MQKIIKIVDKERGIVQITTPDERHYVKSSVDKITGNPVYEYVPSVTWITSYYYKSPRLIKWVAEQGWSEAESIKKLAGIRGSKTHLACEQLIKTGEVKMEDKFENKETGLQEELTVEEYQAVVSFGEWFNEVKPEVLMSEVVVWNNEVGYAGTCDLVCKINGEAWIIDLKTSSDIWPEMELQVSAYKHAQFPEGNLAGVKLGILQLGYKRNKFKKFKFTEVEDQFDLFLAVKQTWKKETQEGQPKQIELPLLVKLTLEAPKPLPVESKAQKVANGAFKK